MPDRYSRSAETWLVLLLLGLATSGFLPAEASASPSKFAFALCDSRLPGGNPPGYAFTSAPPPQTEMGPAGQITYSAGCASPGGGVGVTVYGIGVAGSYGQLIVSVPATPGGFVEKETITAAAQQLEASNAQITVYERGWPVPYAGESTRTFYIRSEKTPGSDNSGTFPIRVDCNPCGEPGPYVHANDIVATEVDSNPPTLSLGGTLLAPGVLRGRQGLSVEARDEGGGVSAIEVLVNGEPAVPTDAASCILASINNSSYNGTVATSTTPCPPALNATWTLDTSVPPFQNGANTVEVCASDFSTVGPGNKTCSVSQVVTVDDSCVESAVPGGNALTAVFARTRKEEVTVPYDAGAKVVGAIVNQAGQAISGATVCIQAQTQGSQLGFHALGTATTDAHGHFAYGVPPGPDREILVGYRHDSFEIAKAIHYRAHIKPTLMVSRERVQNGRSIELTGTLPGRRAGGRVVVLQAGALGSSRWFTFRRATTDHTGAFHSHYRFESTTSTTTYRIRAVVPRQRGFPWEVGHSKPALVEVRG